MSGEEHQTIIETEVTISTLDGQDVAETVRVEVPCRVDPQTGDQFLGADAFEIIDRTKARRMGLLLPEEIRSLRESLSLTQTEMSALLQLGAKTITRWETGRERPSRSLNILLRALRDGRLDPDYLRSLGGQRCIRDAREDTVEYEVIAGNDSVDRMIRKCLGIIHPDDVPRFRKKFKRQPHDGDQVMHTFRELILGAYLCESGFTARYDRKIDGKTPDWTILHPDGRIRALVELTNFHCDEANDKRVRKDLDQGRPSFMFPRCNVPRLRPKLDQKAQRYMALATSHGAAYVVAVFGDFLAVLKDAEIEACLRGDDGLLIQYHALSGVLSFQESGGYRFRYFSNSGAQAPLTIPDGFVPYVPPPRKIPDPKAR